MTIGCPECGALEDIPPLPARAAAYCHVCRCPLERRSGRSIDGAFACATATFVLLFPANLSPLMTVHILGTGHSSVLASGLVSLTQEGWVLLAVMLGISGVALPFIRFGALCIVLGAIRFGQTFRGIGAMYRWALWLDPWTMPDVFLVGCFVGYSRVTQNLTSTVGPGGYCFIAAGFLSMLTRAALDRRAVWRAIGAENQPVADESTLACSACDMMLPTSCEGLPCPRCGLKLQARKPDAIARATALSLAALVLAIPANLFPMTISTQLGRDVPVRIVDGVGQLFSAGLWPLGILIFCTSIAIPFAKIFGMAWFVTSVRRRSRRHLRAKSHLYRLIDELGRWSNVDVFTIVAFVPLIQLDGVASARAGPGATAFALVVFLTMAASRSFDPRLMWDVLPEDGHE
ncbi:paraquat-inducible protein A [Paraburkholderia fynbosensis]|uniref:Intermembrane transport protein YebS n=1 Tax=Paraburkholderia fynbosensis TaxID=1200993 RepID=A0A6J5GWN3_9BURK|nr:paraquat-inducible protein A [Paraburkholderia fynbosensis]CAB3806741.1 Intermembrane transport protein YebS [Paraburkholderia fynbosensis]